MSVLLCFAVFVPVNFNSLVSSVPFFDELNYFDWCEQVHFHLGVLDLDLALQVEKPAAIIDTSTANEKSFHKAWERLNRLSLMFMQMIVVNNIKTTFPKTEVAKKFMKFLEEHSKIDYNSLARTLVTNLTTMKFDGSRSMHEHVIEMTNILARLKTLGMKVDEFFLDNLFLTLCLLSSMGHFK